MHGLIHRLMLGLMLFAFDRAVLVATVFFGGRAIK